MSRFAVIEVFNETGEAVSKVLDSYVEVRAYLKKEWGDYLSPADIDDAIHRRRQFQVPVRTICVVALEG